MSTGQFILSGLGIWSALSVSVGLTAFLGLKRGRQK